MAEEARDAVWVDVLPAMDKFGPEFASQLGVELEQVPADEPGKKIGSKIGAGVIAGVTAAGIAGKALYDIGASFDDMQDTIRTTTGLTGDQLDALSASAKQVGTQVPADFADIGQAVGDIYQRLGYTGPVLETFTAQIMEAGRLSGEAIDVDKVSAAFNVWKIGPEDATASMDMLWRVSQNTGVSINQLTSSTQTAAPALQSLGFSFEQSASLVGSLDKAGMNSTQMLSGMSRAMVNLAKDGEAPQDAFKRVVGEIQDFTAAGDEAAAIDLASQVFGTRGAPQFIQAIKDGTLNMEALTGTIAGGEDTILGAADDTADFAEQWELFKNRTAVELEPLASKLFGVIGDGMGWINDNQSAVFVMAGVATSLFGVSKMMSLFEGASKLATVATAGLSTAHKVLNAENLKGAANWVKNTAALVAHKVASGAAAVAQGAMTAAQWLLNAAMSANPLGIIILLIAAFVAAIILAWNNSETFRAIVVGAWDGIKAAALGVANWFTGTLVPWFTGVLDSIKGGFTTAGEWVGARLEDIRAAGQRVGEFFMVDIPNFFQSSRDLVVGKVTDLKDQLLARLEDIKAGGRRVGEFFTVDIPNFFQSARDLVMGKVTDLKDSAINAFQGLTDGTRAALDGIRSAAAQPVNFVITTVYMNGLRKLVQGVVDLFKLDFNLPTIEPIQLARGAIMGDGKRPILWNEAGPESYIPLNGSQRSKDLWVETGRRLGAIPMAEGGIWPASGTITSGYGYRVGPFYGAELHDGIDIGAALGAAVVAALPGIVNYAGVNGGYGNYVRIDHGGGLQTFYGHLSQILTSVGTMVEAGSLIGLVGSTGASTGPHLHFGASLNGASIDPSGILDGAIAGGGGSGLSILSGITGLIDSLTDIGDSQWAQIAGGAVKSLLGSVKDWFVNKLGSIFSSSSADGGAFDDWWSAAVAIAGPDYAQYRDAVYTVAQHESGLNPNAVNNWDSNAMAGTPSKGLMQFIQSTFNAYAWPGHNDWMNPVDQILAFFRYAPARYGSIWNVPGLVGLSSGAGYSGYAGGTNWAAPGWAVVGERGPELMNLGRGGQQIISNDKLSSLGAQQFYFQPTYREERDPRRDLETFMWEVLHR